MFLQPVVVRWERNFQLRYRTFSAIAERHDSDASCGVSALDGDLVWEWDHVGGLSWQRRARHLPISTGVR